MEAADLLVARNIEFDTYEPLFRQGDLSTVAGHFWPVPLEPGEPRLFTTEPGVQVLGHCHFHHPGAAVLILVHGLEGSSESKYMKRMAAAALQAGFNVIRMNVRNCGGTEHLAPTLYHSGLTCDLRVLTDQLEADRIFLVGFSLGGNQVLKLAGEWGAFAPARVAGVCAISAPIDLAACARCLASLRNRPYELGFLNDLRGRMTRKSQLMPERFSTAALAKVRSIIDFDHYVTAPAFGFRDAWDYYAQSSAVGYLNAIRVPALVIQAQDDPFIPFDSFRLPDNPALHPLISEHGGHVAFLSRKPPRFWAARQVIRFCQAYA